MESSLKEQLRALLQEKSVCHGEFTLASGAKSDFYVDARVTTLDPRGACLIGEVGWELVKKTGSKLGKHVDAIGGLTLGADPVALSIGIAAQRQDPSSSLQVFTVRKAAKEHGRQKRIEGNFSPGNSVVVVDDIITTGGSTIQAIDAIEEAGGQIAFVIVLVDREQGGRENIEKRGHTVVPIFTRSDLIKTDGGQSPKLGACLSRPNLSYFRLSVAKAFGVLNSPFCKRLFKQRPSPAGRLRE